MVISANGFSWHILYFLVRKKQQMSGMFGHLKERISQSGALTIADYMFECLANPEYGYYVHNEPFGASGDFVTAPEVSQVFGELLGLWAVHQWHAMGKPKSFNLIELGPGRGTLMSDALRAAGGLPEFIAGLNVHLVETSQRLRSFQKQALVKFMPTWHDDISSLPDGPIIVIANELFDALPIHQFEYTAHGWLERRVSVKDDQFTFTLWPPEFSIENHVSTAGQVRIGDIFEVSPVSHKIISELAARCISQSGCGLFIDYGHNRSSYGDTLQAVKAHTYVDVLKTPGDADLTAHVDFEALAKSAARAGAIAYGAEFQGQFLKALGIIERINALSARATLDQLAQLNAGRDRLIKDNQMGSLFKVMAIASPDLPPPSGFQVNG
jgi:NADH dehydrogenase [ubiquinone] 1 alpha subcomplex assembly factor 7